MIRTATLLLALTGLLATAGDVAAQRRGGYYGGRGYYNNYNYGSNWGVAISPGYGVSAYYGSTPYYGYSNYYGRGYTRPYYRTYGTPYYNNYYSYSTPNYHSTPAYSSGTIVQAGYSSGDAPSTVATVRVSVPTPDAEVWLGSSPTSMQGFDRQYVSPPLEAGKEYTYTVKARWTVDGKSVEQARDVNVRAGQVSQVDFRTATPERMPAPERRDR